MPPFFINSIYIVYTFFLTFLSQGLLMTGTSKAWLGQFGELGHPYTHPTTKQCNYSYTHPSTQQCDHNHDSIYSKLGHTHDDYLSSTTGVHINTLAALINSDSGYDFTTSVLEKSTASGTIGASSGTVGTYTTATLSLDMSALPANAFISYFGNIYFTSGSAGSSSGLTNVLVTATATLNGTSVSLPTDFSLSVSSYYYITYNINLIEYIGKPLYSGDVLSVTFKFTRTSTSSGSYINVSGFKTDKSGMFKGSYIY